MANILVVDDELGIRDLLSEILSDEGHTVEVAENAAAARAARDRARPDLVLLDIWMPDTDGVTLLKEWRGAGLLTMPVVMMSGHATIDTAVEATRIGAQAFLEKPITMKKLLDAVEAALKSDAIARMRRARDVGRTVQATAPSDAGAGPADHPDNDLADTFAGADMRLELDRPLRDARDDFERVYFEYHLARAGGSMTRVAEKTGLERTHLYRKLKHLGVDVKTIRKVSSSSE